MKTYISILLIVSGLVVVVFGGYIYTKKHTNKIVQSSQNIVKMKTYSGTVSRFYEGDNIIDYSFDIPEDAIAVTGMDGALIKITSSSSSVAFATVYISYEGGRGFTPLDYINEIISPHVSVISPTAITTIGDYEWQVAESEGSEWHIAKVGKEQWLFIVENKKLNHDLVEKTLGSVKVK